MKTLILAVLAIGLASPAFAQSQSCTAQVAEKKLAGAAKASFVAKCEMDAGAACDKQAADKKLAGAAKTSFTTKCVKDAMGT